MKVVEYLTFSLEPSPLHHGGVVVLVEVLEALLLVLPRVAPELVQLLQLAGQRLGLDREHLLDIVILRGRRRRSGHHSIRKF